MVKFTFNMHKARHIHKEYNLKNINPISIAELKKLMSCYGSKEYAAKTPICKYCKLHNPCSEVVNKKFRGIKNNGN